MIAVHVIEDFVNGGNEDFSSIIIDDHNGVAADIDEVLASTDVAFSASMTEKPTTS